MADVDYISTYAWVKSDPEMAAIFDQAQRESWAPDRFQAAIQNTAWWKQHAATERQWVALTNSDPAQANALLNQKYWDFKYRANQLGIAADDATIQSWARLALTYGWSDAQTQHIMGESWRLIQGTPAKGAAGSALQQVNALASDYAINLSDATKQQWVQQIVSGDVTPDEFKSYLAQMATSQWSGLKDVLDRGVTVRQFAEPFLQLAAQELEIDPSSIDLKDPKWQTFLDRRNDKGEWTPMSLREWRSTVRTDPTYGWDKTEGARQQSAQLTTALAQRFGVVG